MIKNIVYSLFILITQCSLVYPEENIFYPTDRLMIDAGIGYSIHINEIKDSPVDYERGGLNLHLRISYFFNTKAGISLLGGYQNLYSYNNQSNNSRLSAYPLELAYNITFNRIKCLAGFGLYFLKSRIEAQQLISKSNYLDFGYFLSSGYSFDIDLIKLTTEIKINYIIDTEIISINPMLSISYSF